MDIMKYFCDLSTLSNACATIGGYCGNVSSIIVVESVGFDLIPISKCVCIQKLHKMALRGLTQSPSQ